MADRLSKVPFRHLAGRIFDRPHLIEHQKLLDILNVLGPRMGFDLAAPHQRAMEDDGPFVPPNPFAHMEHLQALGIELEPAGEGHFVGEGVAIIPVYGTLVQRSDWMSDVSGMMSYGRIERMMNAAFDDARVHELIWEFDTPGGEVAGAFDMADRIYASRGVKPMTAVVNELAASAGYLLASSVGNIAVSRTAAVGSIGVVAAHYDYSKAMEKRGVAVTLIYAGDKKVDGNPFQPLSPEAKQEWQDEIDDTYTLFVETVARSTGLTVEAIRRTKAGIFTGQKAVASKLAARVNTFSNEVSNAVLRAKDSKRTKPAYVMLASAQLSALGIREQTLTHWESSLTEKEIDTMSTTTTQPAAAAPAAAPAPAPAAAPTAEATAAAPAATAPATPAPAAAPRATSERERIKAITTCEEAKGRKSLAEHLAYETDMSVDDAKKVMAASPKQTALGDAMEQIGSPGIRAEEVVEGLDKKPMASYSDVYNHLHGVYDKAKQAESHPPRRS